MFERLARRYFISGLLILAAIVAYLIFRNYTKGQNVSTVLPLYSQKVLVHATSDKHAVLFINSSGIWSIFRTCDSGITGVGYIGRLRSANGAILSNDYGTEGAAELNSPAHGGIDTFGLELARGPGDRTWDNTQHLSMRRCGDWGVTRYSSAYFGLRGNMGFYSQSLWLGDDINRSLVRLRYSYSIFPDKIVLNGAIDTCPFGNCGNYYIKEPKLIVNLNGDLGSWNEISTLDNAGREIGIGECDYRGRNAYRETGHCYTDNRQSIELSDSGNCPCFKVGATSGVGDTWENARGLDRWALDASNLPKAGDSGCVTIDGIPVYSPSQQRARNWEYAVFSDGSKYTGVTVMFKSWDGCKNSLDATSLYRALRKATYYFTTTVSTS